jgi:prophage regulatory protein
MWQTGKECHMQTQLPVDGFVRLSRIIGTDGLPPLVPVSRTCWLDGVKAGRYPASVKIGARAVAWRVSDIRRLIDSLGGSK